MKRLLSLLWKILTDIASLGPRLDRIEQKLDAGFVKTQGIIMSADQNLADQVTQLAANLAALALDQQAELALLQNRLPQDDPNVVAAVSKIASINAQMVTLGQQAQSAINSANGSTGATGATGGATGSTGATGATGGPAPVDGST